MKSQYHILNGDALKEQFPASISGTQIVIRECLVDGDVTGTTLEELFKTRSEFIRKTVPEVSKQDYYNQTVAEISKLLTIPNDMEINLWFEEDLFCQVNLWFTVHTLLAEGKTKNLYLVFPKEPNQYAFGQCSTSELEQFYEDKSPLDKSDLIAKLWEHYKDGDLKELKATAKQLEPNFPFILKAVLAHIDRSPGKEENGIPYKAIENLIDELGTSDLEPIFREFKRRFPIYGFGDLQVNRILNKITKRS